MDRPPAPASPHTPVQWTRDPDAITHAWLFLQLYATRMDRTFFIVELKIRGQLPTLDNFAQWSTIARN